MRILYVVGIVAAALVFAACEFMAPAPAEVAEDRVENRLTASATDRYDFILHSSIRNNNNTKEVTRGQWTWFFVVGYEVGRETTRGTGGLANTTWTTDRVEITATGLPPGLTFKDRVFIWGTPTRAGTYTVTLTAKQTKEGVGWRGQGGTDVVPPRVLKTKTFRVVVNP